MGNLLDPSTGAILLLLLSVLLIVVLTILRRQEWMRHQVREIRAFRDLRKELGRSIESGKPVHFALGSGTLGSGDTITSLAGLRVIEALVDMAVSYDVPPIVTVGDPTLLPLVQDVLRRAYERRQIAELYDPTQVRFVAPSALAYAAGAMPAGVPENVTATITLGAFGSEVSLIADATSRRRIPELAAVDNLQAIGALHPVVDRLAVGEQLYAIGAQFTGEDRALRSLIAEDILRLVLVVAILVAAALALISG